MRFLRRSIWRWAPWGVMLALGGCASQQQFSDFLRTELARATADSIGRTLQFIATGVI